MSSKVTAKYYDKSNELHHAISNNVTPVTSKGSGQNALGAVWSEPLLVTSAIYGIGETIAPVVRPLET